MARWTWPAGYVCPYLAPLVRFLVRDPSAAVRPPSAGAVPVAAPGAALRTAAPSTPLPLITSWRLPQTAWPARVAPGRPSSGVAQPHSVQRRRALLPGRIPALKLSALFVTRACI